MNRLAIKTLNEYRKFDLLTYLGLRYYLQSRAAGTDQWIKDVCVRKIAKRPTSAYRDCKEFKEIDENNTARHRKCFIPGPSEAFAEAFIMDCLSAVQYEIFGDQSHVYSYKLAGRGDTSGMFQYYFIGYRLRQLAVSNACQNRANVTVAIYDIEKFYPTLKLEKTATEFLKQARKCRIDPDALLGLERIISDYNEVNSSEGGVPIGPSISHVIANHALRSVDEKMLERFPGGYFRYVDDFFLVTRAEEENQARLLLSSLLADVGLKLNGDKDDKLSGQDWLEHVPSYAEDSTSRAWSRLVYGIKLLALYKAGELPLLRQMLQEEEIRLPVQEYAAEGRRSGFWARVIEVSQHTKWFLEFWSVVEARKLKELAIEARAGYREEFKRHHSNEAPATGIRRRWYIQRSRFLFRKLLYLENRVELVRAVDVIRGYNELHDLTLVAEAYLTRDVSHALVLAGRGGRMLSHLFSASQESIMTSKIDLLPEERQAIAMLRLYGVPIESTFNRPPDDDDFLLKFVEGRLPGATKVKPHGFYDELFALSRFSGPSAHARILQTLYDEREIASLQIDWRFELTGAS